MTKFHRVAYIMSRFPGLSETFILREMCEMERLGWNLSLYPLIYQEGGVIHEEAKPWMSRAQRPSLSSILKENVKLIFSRPWLYFSTFLKIFLGNISSPKFLSRAVVVFPKAVWMARQMSEEKIEHIHSHYATHSALAAWVVNRITGIPYGITVHAHDIFVDRSMLNQKLKDAQYIVAISNYNRKFLTDHYGEWVAEKIRVIHCGIYPDQYKGTRSQIGQGGKFEIISIGSLRPYKGFTFLLDACSLLKKRSGKNFRCRIIGGGELKEPLTSKIRDLDIADVVELVGPKNQSEVAELLKTANCYVQPSIITPNGKMEGIPVSLMEAMAAGLPVIASSISGIPELVVHEETGLLVPPENPEALVSAILQMWNNSQDAFVLSERGRRLVLNEFDIINTVSLLSDSFEEVLSEDDLWK